MASQSFEEQYGVASAQSRNITTGNSWVQNAGMSPVPSYNFMLRVEGVMDLPCKSVKAFSKELEFELIQEGGLNDYVHMRRKPISKPFYFEVERYIGIDYVDPLPLGAELLLPVILIVSRNAGQFYPAASARTYFFTGCTVIKKTHGDMNADQSGLFVETTTIAYREMVCVNGPWSEALPYMPEDSNPKRSKSQTEALQANKTVLEQAQKDAEQTSDFVREFEGGHEVDTASDKTRTQQKKEHEKMENELQEQREKEAGRLEEQRIKDEAERERAQQAAERNAEQERVRGQQRQEQQERDRTAREGVPNAGAPSGVGE